MAGTENRRPWLDLTEDLGELARLAGAEDAIDELYRRGLDWLEQLVPFDLAAIFVLDKDRLVLRAAAGREARPELIGHTLSLAAFPTIRESIDSRRARAFKETDHRHGDGDPFDGVLDFTPGHSCMVVPLAAGDRVHGVLSLDRRQCETYPAHITALVEIYGRVLGLAIKNAQMSEALLRLSRQEHDRARLLEEEIADPSGDDDVSSRAPAMQEMLARARQVAAAPTPVLILGETGTGKERLARAIHAWSPRAERPFVKINCAAIPAGLLESELFGHVRGAFTGAVKDRAGRFQIANGGTILLDEIGDLPHDLQAKLLRVLQEGTFEPVGSDRTVKVDVRVLAATHVDLEAAIREKRFREDLYYRLSVFPLRLVALRDRKDDIPALARAVLREIAKKNGGPVRRTTKEGEKKLLAHDWPGNVRELANVLERATILASGRDLGPDVLEIPRRAPAAAAAGDAVPDSGFRPLEELEREYIRRALAATNGKIYGKDGAAALLGLAPSTLQSRLKKL